MNILNAIRGIGGEPEIIRTSGAFSLIAFVLSVIGFTIWSMGRGEKFDVLVYCTAFSGGAVAIFGVIAGAVAIKDRGVATARATNVATDTTAAAGAALIENMPATPTPPAAPPLTPAELTMIGVPAKPPLPQVS